LFSSCSFEFFSWPVCFLLVFWIFLFHPSKTLSMGTWECRNIAGISPLHNSLGIFCCGRAL
jgi:hypothetical protein